MYTSASICGDAAVDVVSRRKGAADLERSLFFSSPRVSSREIANSNNGVSIECLHGPPSLVERPSQRQKKEVMLGEMSTGLHE